MAESPKFSRHLGKVEIRPVCTCAMHPAIIIGTVRSLWTWLWGRYHVPQNAFLVSYSSVVCTDLQSLWMSTLALLSIKAAVCIGHVQSYNNFLWSRVVSVTILCLGLTKLEAILFDLWVFYFCIDCGQAVHILVPWSLSSIIWYCSTSVDDLWAVAGKMTAGLAETDIILLPVFLDHFQHSTVFVALWQSALP